MEHDFQWPADTGNANSFRAMLDETINGPLSNLGALLERYRPYLLTIARHEWPGRLRRKLDAEDLVQNTMMQAFAQIRTFRGLDEAEFRGWLRCILLRTVANGIEFLDTLKRSYHQEEALPNGLADVRFQPVIEMLIAGEDACSLMAAKLSLSDRHRQVVDHRINDAFTFQDIGTRMGCSEEAARKLWKRAIHLIAHHLEGR